MSTAALHFDPGFNHFNMGGRSFAWPGTQDLLDFYETCYPHKKSSGFLTRTDVVLEPSHHHNNHQFIGHEIGPYDPEPSMSPPSHSRSITDSPPRMAPEQRELKRQRDQARRDSKLSARIHRAGSHSSQNAYEVPSPPHSAAGDYATTGMSSMPIYTSAPSDLALLTEPTTLAPQMCLPPYSPPLPTSTSLPLHSPPLPSSTSTVFPSPYQAPQYLQEYPYTPSSGSSISSHYA